MAMRDILEHQADTIEYVLHTHGLQAQVDGGKLSPRLAHFRLTLPPGVRPAQVAPIVPEIADTLGVVACRLSTSEEGMYLEVPRPDPVPVRLLPIAQSVADVVPPTTATLGRDVEGTPLLLRLDSPDVDPVLIAGDRRAGKSSLLRGMALSLALHNSPERLRLLLLDCTGEGVAFRNLEGLPHLACPVAYGPVEALVSLRWALRAMSRRAHTRPSDDDELTFGDEDEGMSNTPNGEEAALVIMIDGADTLCMSNNRRAASEGVDALRKLLSNGSRLGIHMVVATGRPEVLIEVSEDWRSHISGAVSSVEAARIATGLKGSGANALLGMGDFMVSLNSELIRFQAGAVSEGEVAKAVALIQECAQIQPEARSQPQYDEVAAPTFTTRRRPVLDRPAFDQTISAASSQPVPLRRSWVGD
jgi:S-DNA-T family DNA segregation ATPase FtsK/SpoIIIE